MDKYNYVDCDKKTSVIMEFTAEEQKEIDARQKAFDDGAEDRAWFALRVKRAKLLAETDWNYGIYPLIRQTQKVQTGLQNLS